MRETTNGLEISRGRSCYDYYVALLFTSNNTLGTLLRSLTWIVNALERDLDQYSMLANAARLLEEALEETPDIEEVRRWEKSSRVTLPLFLRGLEWDIRAVGLQRLLLLWQEMRALELVWEEIAGDCDGEDLRHRDVVAEATALRSRLLELIRDASPKARKEATRTEPGNANRRPPPRR